MATAAIVTAAAVPTKILGVDGTKKPTRRDVSTFINYYRDPGDGSPPMPVRISDTTVKNERPTIPQRMTIRDITGEEDKYTLDGHGFQLCQRATRLRGADFLDSELVKSEYYPEARRLLQDVTGASRVHIFDHKTRVGPSDWHGRGEGNRAAGVRGPLFRAHVDQSYAGAELVLRRHFPAEADELLRRRYQIINIWRPIKTIQKDPLAVAIASSVSEADLVAASILYPPRSGNDKGDRDETWTILPNAGHRWCFKDRQGPDEVLLIKCFDSATACGLARRAPHSAFVDPDVADGCAHRESVEARALVFYD